MHDIKTKADPSFQKLHFEKIVQILGKPFYKDDKSAIYHGDNLDFFSKIPKNSIDLTFTSPPYNIGKEYESSLPVNEYVEWCLSWIKEIHRVTVDDGAFLLNIGYLSIPGVGKAVPITYLLWDKTPFYLQQEIVWNYGAGVAAKKFLSPRNEKILWYLKNPESYIFNLDEIRDPDVAYPNQKKKGKLRCNTIGKNPSDVWQIAKVTSGANRSSIERTPHPAQFPLDLCERVVRGFSAPNSLVIDPFLGSGSSLDSCSIWGRYSIGFELREDYCELAAKRLETRNNDLFTTN